MIYEAQCSKCNKVHEYSAKVAEMYDTPECCGQKSVFGIFTPPMTGAMSWGREKSFTHTDGTFIETGAQWKRYMKENNMIPVEEGRQEAARAKKQREAKFDAELHHTVRESYQQLAS